MYTDDVILLSDNADKLQYQLKFIFCHGDVKNGMRKLMVKKLRSYISEALQLKRLALPLSVLFNGIEMTDRYKYLGIII